MNKSLVSTLVLLACATVAQPALAQNSNEILAVSPDSAEQGTAVSSLGNMNHSCTKCCCNLD